MSDRRTENPMGRTEVYVFDPDRNVYNTGVEITGDGNHVDLTGNGIKEVYAHTSPHRDNVYLVRATPDKVFVGSVEGFPDPRSPKSGEMAKIDKELFLRSNGEEGTGRIEVGKSIRMITPEGGNSSPVTKVVVVYDTVAAGPGQPIDKPLRDEIRSFRNRVAAKSGKQ